jgi:N-acyl-D-aspartate/D-glutamate deacylase
LSKTSIRVVLPWSTWAMMAILRRDMGTGALGMVQRQQEKQTAKTCEKHETPAASEADWRFSARLLQKN